MEGTLLEIQQKGRRMRAFGRTPFGIWNWIGLVLGRFPEWIGNRIFGALERQFLGPIDFSYGVGSATSDDFFDISGER